MIRAIPILLVLCLFNFIGFVSLSQAQSTAEKDIVLPEDDKDDDIEKDFADDIKEKPKNSGQPAAPPDSTTNRYSAAPVGSPRQAGSPSLNRNMLFAEVGFGLGSVDADYFTGTSCSFLNLTVGYRFGNLSLGGTLSRHWISGESDQSYENVNIDLTSYLLELRYHFWKQNNIGLYAIGTIGLYGGDGQDIIDSDFAMAVGLGGDYSFAEKLYIWSKIQLSYFEQAKINTLEIAGGVGIRF